MVNDFLIFIYNAILAAMGYAFNSYIRKLWPTILNRIYYNILRLTIAILAYAFIALRLGAQGFQELLLSLAYRLSSTNISIYILLFFMMLVVWALEAYKWKLVLAGFYPISFTRSWKSVWYGVVAGQLTPNRLGEPVGRVALLESGVRGKGIVAAFYCSLTQQIATIIFGVWGLFWWYFYVHHTVFSENVPYLLVYVIFASWVVALVFMVLRFDKLCTFLERNRLVNRLIQGEKLCISFSRGKLAKVLFISVLRYVVFSSQFVMLLSIFGVNAAVLNLFAAIGLTYLFTSIVPTFAASEVGVRVGFSIWFIGMLSDNEAGIAAASLALWVLNLAIPAVVAAWFPWSIRSKIRSR